MTFVNCDLTGPTTAVAGVLTSNFTLTPRGAIAGVYTPQDSGRGGTFTPSSVSWTADSTPRTFTYTAANTPGNAIISCVWSVGGPGAVTSPPYLQVQVSGSNPPQHIYQYPQFGGVPPFQILSTNNQIPGANLPPTRTPQHIYFYPQVAGVVPFQFLWVNNQIPAAAPPVITTYTQAISPTSAPVPATAVLTYTLSATLSVDIHITPVATNGTFSPTSVTIPSGSLTGTTTLSDSVVGISTISSTNDQSLPDPANITFNATSSVSSSRGTFEAGTGSIIGIPAGGSVILMGPWQTPFRVSLKEVVSVQANGTFNLDYQFSTDNGTTWYTGRQVPSVVSAADGTATTNRAHMKIEPGWYWRIQITNTDAGSINAVYEKRFTERGQWGS